MSTPSTNVANIAPMRLLMRRAAQAPNAAEPPALFTSATMMPSITRNRKMPAFHESASALMKPTPCAASPSPTVPPMM